MDKKNIKIAKRKYWAPNIEYLVGDATKDLPNQKFDVIILSNVLEHIENRIEFLNKIKNLAPKILIRVPMIKEKLGWLPNYPLRKGMERTYAWIEEMVKREMV